MSVANYNKVGMRTPVIKWSDMSEEKKSDAISFATRAMIRFYNEDEMAGYIRLQFDKKYGKSWHCFVGRNFGSSVYYEETNYIYFYIGTVGFLIFKSGAL